MARLSSKYPALLLLLVVAVAVISSAPRSADAARLSISWPKWNWCFPECVIGETCYFKVYNFCKHTMKRTSFFNCYVVALEWCDLEHMYINDLILPPPGFHEMDGQLETERDMDDGL